MEAANAVKRSALRKLVETPETKRMTPLDYVVVGTCTALIGHPGATARGAAKLCPDKKLTVFHEDTQDIVYWSAFLIEPLRS